MKQLLSWMIVGAAVGLSGCASIVGSPIQVVPIASTPSEAEVLVVDEAGVQVFAGKTPTSVSLNKSTGHYWGGKSYTVTIRKDGYKDQTIPITSSANGWYIGGNLLFGGLIGWFVVDPLNGNMYTLSPDAVSSTLEGKPTAHNNAARDGSISVVLLEDVPAQLRSKLVRVN